MPLKSDPARSECPIANALDLLGDRWTLLVLRDLIFYRRHEFGEFLNGGEGIATNVLADRLERLCCAGLVVRFHHPTNGKKYVYRVTETGIDLIPTMIELVVWSERHLPAVRVPPERMAPLVKDRINFTRELRRTLLAELKAGGQATPGPKPLTLTMPYDESLASRIERHFTSKHVSFESRRIMGGLVFMMNDKMCVGVEQARLMARIDPAEQAAALARKGCTPMDFTGRPMRGFVFVSTTVLRTDAQLKSWLDLALAFNPKAVASKRPRKQSK